jgi:hypothetical protein
MSTKPPKKIVIPVTGTEEIILEGNNIADTIDTLPGSKLRDAIDACTSTLLSLHCAGAVDFSKPKTKRTVQHIIETLVEKFGED